MEVSMKDAKQMSDDLHSIRSELMHLVSHHDGSSNFDGGPLSMDDTCVKDVLHYVEAVEKRWDKIRNGSA